MDSKDKGCKIPLGKDGKPSQLYKDLVKSNKNDRQYANYIYAVYLQSGVAAQMDSKYPRNHQNQHSARDVMAFLGANNILKDDIKNIAVREGFMSHSHDYITFTDAEEAITRADDFNKNDNFKRLVATVVAANDGYSVVLASRDALTQHREYEVGVKAHLWKAMNEFLITRGINIDFSSPDFKGTVANAFHVNYFIKEMSSLPLIKNGVLSQNDLKAIIKLGVSIDPTIESQLQRISNIVGSDSLDEVAKFVYEYINDKYANRKYNDTPAPYVDSHFQLVEALIRNCRNAITATIGSDEMKDAMTSELEYYNNNSKSYMIENTIIDLHSEYNILDNNEIAIGESLTNIRELLGTAVTTLSRQIREIIKQQGDTDETRRLKEHIEDITRDINENRYHLGVIRFLQEAQNQITQIKNLWDEAGNYSFDDMTNIGKKSDAYMKIYKCITGYGDILKALASEKSGLIDFIDDAYKETILKTATELHLAIIKEENNLKSSVEGLLAQVLKLYLGPDGFNGVSIVDLVKEIKKDGNWFDTLYSATALSSPVAGVIGAVIRDAQDKRNRELAKIAIRIRKAADKLRAAGESDSFMFEYYNERNNKKQKKNASNKTGRIVSDIDWDTYYDMRSKAYWDFYNAGLRDMDLVEEMRAWEEDSTKEIPVHIKDGVVIRTERIPNDYFLKPESQRMNLTPAQKEYYDEMLLIKGELETLMPEHARGLYRAPQIRRGFIDSLIEEGVSEFFPALSKKIANIWTLREDDTDYNPNNTVEGEDYVQVLSDYDSTSIKEIPVFYKTPLANTAELRTNFTAGMISLAASAINYNCMHEIQSAVELMTSYVEGMFVADTDQNGVKKADVVETRYLKIVKWVRKKFSKSKIADIVRSHVDAQMYNEKIDDPKKWTKLLLSLIGYSSIKNLAVNVLGGAANFVGGTVNTFIEASAGEYFNWKSYLWAVNKVVGVGGFLNNFNALLDFFTSNKKSKYVLILEMFDPFQDNFHSYLHNNHHFNWLRKLYSKNFTLALYEFTEKVCRLIIALAILYTKKVKVGNNVISLYKALQVTNKEDGNAELVLAPGAQHWKENIDLEEQGSWENVDSEYIEQTIRDIRYCAGGILGAMSSEDYGTIHRYVLGKMFMNMRQWMVNHYSKRYRGEHYDFTARKARRGYWTTTKKFAVSLYKDLFKAEAADRLYGSVLTKEEKKNLNRVTSDMILVAILGVASNLIGDADDYDEWWQRVLLYLLKRAFMELNAGTPWGLFTEAQTMINSPIAATNTITGLIYPIIGIPDILKDDIKRGTYEDWNPYLAKICKYTVPFYEQIRRLVEIEEDESIFKVFNKGLV